jgi:hypothetical protein
MTTTTVYRSGDISNTIANIGGVADFYGCSMWRAEKTMLNRFDDIAERDYPDLFLNWIPGTSEVYGDANEDYSDVDFDEIFEEIGDCFGDEYEELAND